MAATKKLNGASLTDRLAAIRSEIQALKVELAEVEAAPRSRGESLQRLRGWVEARGQEWRPNVALFAAPDARPDFDFKLLRPGPDGSPDIEAALCALAPNAVISGLEQMLVRQLDAQGGGIAAPERRERLATLRDSLLEAEIREEELCRDAESQGMTISRRGDARAEIVLGLIDQLAA